VRRSKLAHQLPPQAPERFQVAHAERGIRLHRQPAHATPPGGKRRIGDDLLSTQQRGAFR